MKFIALPVDGAFLVELEKNEDERGFFTRSWCKKEFEAQGLKGNLAQCSISFNKKKLTLRGMHYQCAPYVETKLVRCTMGAIYDVIIDLRPDSLTFKKWHAVELSARNHKMLYIPENFAHGYLTLEDNSEVFYQISEFYHPECSKGLRWDDPAFGIKWPKGKKLICDRDLKYADFKI
jgi:dTDP-4-dehydrorhamnose 3,5-epimerase